MSEIFNVPLWLTAAYESCPFNGIVHRSVWARPVVGLFGVSAGSRRGGCFAEAQKAEVSIAAWSCAGLSDGGRERGCLF